MALNETELSRTKRHHGSRELKAWGLPLSPRRGHHQNSATWMRGKSENKAEKELERWVGRAWRGSLTMVPFADYVVLLRQWGGRFGREREDESVSMRR